MAESGHNFYKILESSNNFLLLKGEVGKTKPSIHTLPPGQFVYGKTTGEDKECARDLIKHWQFHQNSKQFPSEVDYKLLNSMSVKNGLSTASQFKLFRKEKDVRIQASLSSSNRNLVPNITFGVPLRPATPIKAVISNMYGRVAINQMHQMYSTTPSLKINKWKSTKGFDLMKNSKLKSLETQKSSSFKMKKFTNVRPRTNCWRRSEDQPLE